MKKTLKSTPLSPRDLYVRVEGLYQAFVESGFNWSKIAFYNHLYRWEKKGLIVCPRDPSTGQRLFTLSSLKEIVKAFSPGGTGQWRPA